MIFYSSSPVLLRKNILKKNTAVKKTGEFYSFFYPQTREKKQMPTYAHICLTYEQLHNDSGTNKYKKYTWCWYKRSISMESKLLYEWLRTYSKNGWCAWPKQETLAFQLGKHPKTIRRWIAELVEAGLIEKIKTKISGVWNLTYVFLPHPDMPAAERSKLMAALDALHCTNDQQLPAHDRGSEKSGSMGRKTADQDLERAVKDLQDLLARCNRGEQEALDELRQLGRELGKGLNGNRQCGDGADKQLEPDRVPDNLSHPSLYRENKKEEKKSTPSAANPDASLDASEDLGVFWTDPAFSDDAWITARKKLHTDMRLPAPVRGSIDPARIEWTSS
ncbi:MAG: helix-turn-helix domain-containing protein [Desulfobulbus sp.]|jgi:hypothetical protein|uniref:helix-turn-helix domain-containing protein n=1 Tax=Desulfobulbus sp. TaxID=895 RepID=UPI00283CF96E|nr:helix-turn-helix domain-containing protein [Desulfobulbus sp.]MDR2549152.1 helix-turn-helix domain-containing protein [Desulfobulbus sp.]